MPTSPSPISPAAAEFGVLASASVVRNSAKTQEQLAADSDVHWSFLGQVERGRRNLTLHNILKVAAALKMDPGDLMRGLQPPAHS